MVTEHDGKFVGGKGVRMIHLTGITPGRKGGGGFYASVVFRLEPLQRVLWSCEVYGSCFCNLLAPELFFFNFSTPCI